MKEIKTARYIIKEALFSLPGDPGLPSDVTEREISEQGNGLEEDIISNQQGETEIKVDWPKFNEWYVSAGESLPEILSSKISPSSVSIEYTYSYDYGTEEASDIRPIQLKDYVSKQMIIDPNIVGAFVDYFDRNIKNDIEIAESDAKLERNPDYNPF